MAFSIKKSNTYIQSDYFLQWLKSKSRFESFWGRSKSIIAQNQLYVEKTAEYVITIYPDNSI